MNTLVLEYFSKTKCIVFGPRYMLTGDHQLNFLKEGLAVKQVKKTRLLNVTSNAALFWSEHIDNVVIQIAKDIAITRKCSDYLTSSTLHRVIQLWFCHT